MNFGRKLRDLYKFNGDCDKYIMGECDNCQACEVYEERQREDTKVKV